MQEGKRCSRCGRELPLGAFHRDLTKRDGVSSACGECRQDTRRRRAENAPGSPEPRKVAPTPQAAAETRLRSNYDALRPEDFDVAVGNDGRIDPSAGREKRQEFSESMGDLAEALAQGGGDLESLPAHLGTYVARLAEQERRFANRGLARSVSLLAAHEALRLRLFKAAAREYFAEKIVPTGYATQAPPARVERTACLVLSDLHLGANLSERDNPLPFGAVQEARRLEYLLREVLDDKPERRRESALLLLLGGDLIEGMLGHDLRDSAAELAEQTAIFWRYFSQFLALCAQQYPRVHVECQPGNHGRDKLRHPGRAYAAKWASHEWTMYYALAEMCSRLPNMTFSLPYKAFSLVDLYGATLLLTHGDTEIAIGDPDACAARNAQILERINAAGIYGGKIDVAVFGHYHKPRYQPRRPRVLFNGALIPPNGFARSKGYLGEPCGQWFFEAVPGDPIRTLRFLEVGPAQDQDDRLGTLIKPFRFR